MRIATVLMTIRGQRVEPAAAPKAGAPWPPVGSGTRIFLAVAVMFMAVAVTADAQQALAIGETVVVDLGDVAAGTAPVSLHEAIEQGLVESQFQAVPAVGRLAVQVQLTNRTKRPVRIAIGAGTILRGESDPAPLTTGLPRVQAASRRVAPRQVAITGGQVDGIAAYCVDYERTPPRPGEPYRLVTDQSQQARQDHPVNKVLTVLESGSVDEAVRRVVPRSWAADANTVATLTRRAESLAIWASTGVAAAHEPLDFLLLEPVRQVLEQAGLPDPYEQIAKAENPADPVVRVLASIHRDPSFERAGEALEGTSLGIADFSADLLLQTNMPQSDRSRAIQDQYLGSAVPTELLRDLAAAEASMPTPPTVPPERARERLDAALSRAPQSLQDAFRQHERTILAEYEAQAAQETTEALAGLIEKEIPSVWKDLSPVARARVVGCLRIETMAALATEDADILRGVWNPDTPAADYLRQCRAACERIAAGLASGKMRDGRVGNLPSDWQSALADPSLEETTLVELDDALYAVAEASVSSSRETRDAVSSTSRLAEIAEAELQRISDTFRQGFEDLDSPDDTAAFLTALQEMPVNELPANMAGAAAAKEAYRLLLAIRKAAENADDVVLRVPESLREAGLPMWDLVFHATGQKGFERDLMIRGTERSDLTAAVENARYAPQGQVRHIIVNTVPQRLSEAEYQQSTSPFLQLFRNTYPEFGSDHYNRQVADIFATELARIKLNPNTIVLESVETLSNLDISEDMTLCLTLVGHNLGQGQTRLEMPGRPDGIGYDELKGYVESLINAPGKRVNLELGLIICNSQGDAARDLASIEQVRGVLAPRGSIPAQSGIQLLRAAIQLRQPGERLDRAYFRALTEYLRTPNFETRLPLESFRQLPEPQVNRKWDGRPAIFPTAPEQEGA